jgi:hypothetical protein
MPSENRNSPAEKSLSVRTRASITKTTANLHEWTRMRNSRDKAQKAQRKIKRKVARQKDGLR